MSFHLTRGYFFASCDFADFGHRAKIKSQNGEREKRENVFFRVSRPGLPDGLFSNPKIPI
jgi:hypothetical protein